PDDVVRIHLLEPAHHLLEVRVREHQGISTGKKDFPDLSRAGKVAARLVELFGRNAPSAASREMPPETKPAIGGASIAHEEQSAVSVVVDQALGDEITGVPDRVGGLVVKHFQ